MDYTLSQMFLEDSQRIVRETAKNPAHPKPAIKYPTNTQIQHNTRTDTKYTNVRAE